MRSTAIDRRTLLIAAAAAGIAPGRLLAAADAETLFIAARRRAGRFEIAVVDEAGGDRLVLPLETRGHAFAVDRTGRQAIAFSRQPGRFAIGFDLDGKRQPTMATAAPDRHFYGHGVFADDRLLLATENDYADAQGVIGVYSVEDGLKRIGEFPSGGLDPHEAVLMPDGRTLCVAHGGILTHPDYGKLVLNPDTMAPTLTYVDTIDGEILETVSLDKALYKLAFHHLAVDGTGAVWFGLQYHGPQIDRPPLVGRHRRGRVAELFSGPPEILRGLANYIGSVAVDRSGTIVATSSPKGGLVAYWDAATGRSLGATALADGCGVAAGTERPFRMTSGTGAMVEAGPEAEELSVTTLRDGAIAWDNHMMRIDRGQGDL